MKKVVGLITGIVCGTIVGAAASLLLSPRPNTDIREQLSSHWENAKNAAKEEMEQTQQTLQSQFEQKRPQ